MDTSQRPRQSFQNAPETLLTTSETSAWLRGDRGCNARSDAKKGIPGPDGQRAKDISPRHASSDDLRACFNTPSPLPDDGDSLRRRHGKEQANDGRVLWFDTFARQGISSVHEGPKTSCLRR